MKQFFKILFAIIIGASLTACHHDDDKYQGPADFALLMYMPWSETLTSQLQGNLRDMQRAMSQANPGNKRVVAFLSLSGTEAVAYDISAKGISELKRYSNPDITSAEGISAILRDLVALAPAREYGMTIGCHGTGWLPKGALSSGSSSTVLSTSAANEGYKPDDSPTRFYGGLRLEWQTDVSTLVEAIGQCGVRLNYILFDACYMGGVEVAYEMRECADYLALSPTEIMKVGMPYEQIGAMLLNADVDWQGVCDAFYRFYSSYSYPCGTLSVIKTEQMERLAAAMKGTIASGTWNEDVDINELQALGGYVMRGSLNEIYYDLGQYVSMATGGNDTEFKQALADAVIASLHTGSYYVAGYGMQAISHYSGLSTSAPATASIASGWKDTSWAKAISTHDI